MSDRATTSDVTHPHGLPEIRLERAMIPMGDGVRLSAQLWMPLDASPEHRYPPLVEYAPYRVDDMGINDTYILGSYAARHGYVHVRVEMRGTGRSEGVLPPGEYSAQEIDDGLEAIEWLAAQPWSTGHVGMWGKSWTGINTLMVARRRPPALGAIVITASAPDHEFHDDKFFEGFLNIDAWDLWAEQLMSLSGAPDFPLDEETLANRFDQPPWLLTSCIREQRDGPFWKRQALGGDYDAITVPVLWFAGWYDGNQDSVPRVLEHLRVPVKAIVGPWDHGHPDEARPGPRILWQREAVRWWDRWLKDIDTGVTDEPKLAVYVRRWHPSGSLPGEAPGDWRYEEGWPIERSTDAVYHLGPGRVLSAQRQPAESQQLRYVASTGTTVQMYWEGFLADPRPDEAYSLLFDSEPLDADLEILGSPRALLRGSADAPLAHWFVRLGDVAPDGTVTTVTGAGINGAQRRSATHPEALEPGVTYPFEFDLHFTSWTFPKGHRIRVSICNAWWPVAWPTPYPMTTTLELGGDDGSRIVLPTIPFEERPAPSYLPPEPITLPLTSTGSGPQSSLTRHADGKAVLREASSHAVAYAWGREATRSEMVYTVDDEHPDLASVHGELEMDVDMDDRRITWRTDLDVESTATELACRIRRQLFLGGLKIRERSWEDRITRDHH